MEVSLAGNMVFGKQMISWPDGDVGSKIDPGIA